ncbi:hypothetical protein GCM10027162_63220 [Streptomyces incanus]
MPGGAHGHGTGRDATAAAFTREVTAVAKGLVAPLGPRPGTVGLPVPGTVVRIADDGAVLVEGGIAFGAYRNDPAATDEVLTDGWFATGGLGSLDDGCLTVTGREKDILVTSGGKNVSRPSWRTVRAATRPSASTWSPATSAPAPPRSSPSTRRRSGTGSRCAGCPPARPCPK